MNYGFHETHSHSKLVHTSLPDPLQIGKKNVEFYPNRMKSIESRGEKISFMHVTEVWSPLSRFLQISIS
jgi:hypothetical protein